MKILKRLKFSEIVSSLWRKKSDSAKSDLKIKPIFYFSQREVEQKNAEDVLFDMFQNEATGLLPMGKFLAVSLKIEQISVD